MNKFMLVLAMFLIAIVPAFASAESFVIDKVFVNDVQVNGDKAQVDIGDNVEVVVEVVSGQNLTRPRDVKVAAELGNCYEHETIRDSTSMFTIHPGSVRYRKSLELSLPSDMDPTLCNLYVMVYDSTEKVERQFTLYVEQQRHLLEILGVVVPTPYVAAGQTANVEVRIRNDGSKDESDVKIVAAIDALKASSVKWTDLVAEEYVGDDEENSETILLPLLIPADAVSGEYELEVGIAYNGGHDTQVVATKINVRGVGPKVEAPKEAATDEPQEPIVEEPKTPVDPSKELTLAFDTTSQHVAAGKETSYKLTISNLASESRDITITAAGAQLFADIRIDPSTLTIEGGQKADVYIYAKAKTDAELKVSPFTLRIMKGDKLYKEVSLSLGVEEAAKEKSNFLPFEDDTLKIIFIGLVVILIIVGLIIAFRRVRGDDYPLEPIEERIYY